MHIAVALLALVPLAYRASAQSTFVQPATYRSPSGALELGVDPSACKGAGEATYRLERGGALVWEREHAFTLLEALVRDDGRVAGYGLTAGIGRVGEIVIAVLGSDGGIVAEERVPQSRSRSMHGPPEPHVLGLVDLGEVFALEIAHGKPRWIHAWSDGRFQPQARSAADGRAPERVHPLPAAAVDELPELPFHARVVALDWPIPITPEVLADHARRSRAPRHLLFDGRRVWVSEYMTHVTHAFDLDGRRLAERVPAPDDFRPNRPGDWLAVRGDGHLFVHGDSAVVEFDGEGQRVGRTSVELLTTWLLQPGSSRRWEVGGGEVTLFDGDGRVLARHPRGANRRWFRWLSAAAVAPGGELVVLDEPFGSDTRDPTGSWIQVLDRTGRPSSAFLAPASRRFEELATDGERIALRAGHELVLLRVDGTPLGRFELPPETASARGLAFAQDELWVLERGRARLLALRCEER